MNRDEILALAREIENHAGWSALYLMGEDLAVAFASRIESLVREEAAKECEKVGARMEGIKRWDCSVGAGICAAAIRKS
jgi:predicted translin family RNA/ssDNA-binding protein